MGAGGFGVFGGGFRALLEFRFGGWRGVGLYCWIFGLGVCGVCGGVSLGFGGGFCCLD